MLPPSSFQCKASENGITEQQYIQPLLAPFHGIRHPEDTIASLVDALQAFEPWAGSLREVATESTYEPLHDTLPYESLFLACINGDESLFKTTFQALLTQKVPNVLQPVACFAAQKRNHHILKYCLEQGAISDRFLERAAQIGAKASPEMFQALLEADWAGIKSSGEAVERQIQHFGKESFEAQWLRENAGEGEDSPNKNIAKTGEEREEREEKEWKCEGENKKAEGATGPGSSRKVKKGGSGGRNESKGKVKGDPKQGPSPEQLQKWFGDVPW